MSADADDHGVQVITDAELQKWASEASESKLTDFARGLSGSKRRAVKKGLGLPGRQTTDLVWMIAILGFATVLLVSAITICSAVFLDLTDTSATQTVLTVFTTTVGFLSGLFVPSPAGKPEASNSSEE